MVVTTGGNMDNVVRYRKSELETRIENIRSEHFVLKEGCWIGIELESSGGNEDSFIWLLSCETPDPFAVQLFGFDFTDDVTFSKEQLLGGREIDWQSFVNGFKAEEGFEPEEEFELDDEYILLMIIQQVIVDNTEIELLPSDDPECDDESEITVRFTYRPAIGDPIVDRAYAWLNVKPDIFERIPTNDAQPNLSPGK